MNVIGWINHLRCHTGGRNYGGRIDGIAVQHSFRCGQTPRPVVDTDDADMRVHDTAYIVEIVEGRDTGEREVAATTSEFLKAPAPCGGP